MASKKKKKKKSPEVPNCIVPAAVMIREIQRLSSAEYEMRNALETLVKMYVANRGRSSGHHSHEFITCITPDHRSNTKDTCEVWHAWDMARRALGEDLKYVPGTNKRRALYYGETKT
jgi:hypothetical protein